MRSLHYPLDRAEWRSEDGEQRTSDFGSTLSRVKPGALNLLKMINWIYFPRSDKPTPLALDVVRAFEAAEGIDSAAQKDNSNFVLRAVAAGLQDRRPING